MTLSPGAEVAALVITVLVHIIGAGVLIWAMLGEERPSWRDLWGGDDDGGGGPLVDRPDRPGGGGDRAPVPLLPESGPPAVRLREAGRLGDAHPRPARRPVHPREPHPERAPASEPR
jgi:hypothetical protein